MVDKNFIDEIKRNNSIVDTARRLGLELHRAGREYRTYSIFNKGDNNSCTVFNNDNGLFYDFKAGIGGDVIDLVAELKFNGDKGSAINELSGGRAYSCSNEYKKYVRDLQTNINKWHAALRAEDIDYLTGRGLTREYIDKMCLGYNSKEQRLIIPYFERGQVVYYTGRDMSGQDVKDKYKKAYINGFNKNIIWGLHTLDRTDKPLIIAEGAFDAMSCDIAGYRVLAGMGGLSKKDIEVIRGYTEQERKNEQDIYICFDNDEAGQGFFKRLAIEFISRRIFNFKRLALPAQYKDISDYFTDGGDLQTLIDSPLDGLSSFADTFAPSIEERAAYEMYKETGEPIPNEIQAQTEKRQNECKNFMFNIGRFISKIDLYAIVRKMYSRDYFDEEWLEMTFKTVYKPPLEDDVIAAVQKEHDIIYKAAAGFYEYDGTIWSLIDDKFIGSYIGAELGRIHTKGGRITSIRENFKTKAIQQIEFDKKPLLVFKNGTLEFETGKFRGCDKSDLATILLPYVYDPAAQCPKFKEFLEKIFWRADRKLQDADGDARIALMQEFAGYMLYPNCQFQKALLLLGVGSNGKSTLIDLIKAAFGEQNFASVEVDQLSKQFKAVELIGKLANITTETGLNFGGAESIFKKLVAGEEVSDCFKFQNNFTFKTRAKFIIAANKLPRAEDTSYGFNRRFIMLNLQNEFVEDHEPNIKKLELRTDTKAKDELMTELPGIFNWIYAGYKRLKERGKFTESPDHKALMDEFIANNNPVDVFVEEEQPFTCFGSINREDLYKKYQEWAKNNGYGVKNKRNFLSEFRAVLKRRDIEFEETRPHTGAWIFKF